MKLSVFKKLIRDVIREELDYKFSALEKKLDEVVVKSNINNIDYFWLFVSVLLLMGSMIVRSIRWKYILAGYWNTHTKNSLHEKAIRAG